MRLVQRKQIEIWAVSYNAKADLPALITRLVRGSMPISTYTFFPAGTAAYVSGYDGIVNSDVDYRYVPSGTSLWEFGTERTINKKANEDYKKRTENPEGHNPSERTLVFLTPRFWKDKDKWRTEKLKEGIWKDIRAYDSRDIEEWFDETPAVSRWFAAMTNSLPFDGIVTIDEFWAEFARGKAGELPPLILTGGREPQVQQLFNFLSSEPDIQAVRAATKDEATAFIIACAKQFEDGAQSSFLSKSLIIEHDSNFRSLQNNSRGLNIIAKFEKLNILYPAIEKGHHVLVPLGADDTFNQNIITLPSLDRDLQVSSLINMGFSDEDSRRLSIDAGRDITVLRRLLKFPQNRIKWIDQDMREIIPALIVGRWHQHKPGDRKLIEIMSGESYDQFEKKLLKWSEFAESPIMHIGETWRLTSPLDAWSIVGSWITEKDFANLTNVIRIALKDGNPYIEKDDNPFSLANEREYSTWAREGLLQSLILIGIYGKGLKLKGIGEPQSWVDDVVDNLFDGADSNLWIALDRELPLLAEASPDCFIQHVNLSLKSPKNTLLPMFMERPGVIIPSAHHTGMLWALESLAWMPEYLEEATFLLARMARLDPGIKMANKPINSLLEIYKSWHHQTLSNLDQRMKVLRSLIKEDEDIAWKVLFSILHTAQGVAQPTHKPRWRLFGTPTDISITQGEYTTIGQLALELLLSFVGYDSNRIVKLLERSTELDVEQRNLILSYVKTVFGKVSDIDNKIWSKLRNILSENRSHPDARWALLESELQPYEILFRIYEPSNYIEKMRWLFDEHWPKFVEGGNIRDSLAIENHGQKISRERTNAINYILNVRGIKEVIRFGSAVKEPWTVGEALSRVENSTMFIDEIIPLLEGSTEEINLATNFFRNLSFSRDLAWIEFIYRKLTERNLSIHVITTFLISLNQTGELWNFIDNLDPEIVNAYWRSINPILYGKNNVEIILALEHLESCNRHLTAIEVAVHLSNDSKLDSKTILKLLTNAAVLPSDEKRTFPGYEIGNLFALLDERDDTDEAEMIKLEYLYLSLLDGYKVHRLPKYLHNELSKNPLSFVEIIKWAYMPKNRDLIAEEKDGMSEEQLASRGQQAYKLLSTMKKLPGMDQNQSLDRQFLKGWVLETRELAMMEDRLEVTDLFIGKLLAQFPEDGTDNWPDETIADIIEQVGTENILSGFSTALFNKRGSSTRGAFAGGEIERGHAEYFDKLHKRHKLKHYRLSKVFSNLSRGYMKDAKRQDDRATRDKLDY